MTKGIREAKPFGLAVSALIDDGAGRYLLLRRSPGSKHFAGQWEAPGGKIDAGEHFAAALLREVKEETGLDVVLDGAAAVTEFELPAIRVVLLHMWAHVASGTIKLSDEHQAYEWVGLEGFRKKDLSDKARQLPDVLAPATHSPAAAGSGMP